MDLNDDIQKQTGGKGLHINTLKRVMDHWGKEKRGEENYRHTVNTLNIIALYLGYKDWEHLKRGYARPRSSYITPPPKYNKGDKMTIVYAPNRKIHIESLGNMRWKVLEVNGGKLQEGDEFTARTFYKDASLVLHDLKRGNRTLGDYISSGFVFETKLQRSKKEW